LYIDINRESIIQSIYVQKLNILFGLITKNDFKVKKIKNQKLIKYKLLINNLREWIKLELEYLILQEFNLKKSLILRNN